MEEKVILFKENKDNDNNKQLSEYFDSKYSSLLDLIEKEIFNKDWLRSTDISKFLLKNLDWNVAKRHLYLAFSISTSLNMNPIDYLNLWIDYTRIRIIPILSFNKMMDELSWSSSNRSDNIKSINSGLSYITTQLEWLKKNKNIEYRPFWENYYDLTLNMIDEVFKETQFRFNTDIIKRKNVHFSKFNSHKNPLNRSCMFRTFFLGLSAINKYKIKDPQWVINYDFARQLLDDLRDIKPDIETGRLTYPVQYAMQQKVSGNKVANFIYSYWNSPCYPDSNQDSMWQILQKHLKTSGTIEHCTNKIITMLNMISTSILNEQLPGDTTDLFKILEWKTKIIKHFSHNINV